MHLKQQDQTQELIFQSFRVDGEVTVLKDDRAAPVILPEVL